MNPSSPIDPLPGAHRLPGSKIRYLLYIAGFAFFFWYTLLPVLGSRLSRIPGSLVDPRFNLYLLEHAYKYITGQDAAFWTAGFFYPHQNVVAYSDNFLGTFMFFAPFRMLGFDRETAYQLWILTGFALNFAAMALVLDRYGFRRLAVLLGAAVFAFSPVQLAHLDHIQVLYRMPVPLAWYFLDRFLDDYCPRRLGLALGFLAWQFYMSMYLGYFLFLLMTFQVLAVVVERKGGVIGHYLDATSERARLGHLALTVAFGLSLFPLAVHYAASGISRNTAHDVLQLLPRPVSYMSGSRLGIIERILGADFDVESYLPWEHTLFVGLVPWGALLAGTILAFRGGNSGYRNLRRVALLFWGIFLLTLSIHEISLYRLLLRCVPMLSGIRVMARVVHILLLPFAYMTAVAVDRLSRRPPSWFPATLADAPALALCLVFAWESKVGSVTVSKADAQQRVARLEKRLGMGGRRTKVSDTGPVLAVLSPGKTHENAADVAYLIQLDAMLAAQDLNIQTVNGYSRFLAPGFRYLTDCRVLEEVLGDYARNFPASSNSKIANRIQVVDARVFHAAGPLPDEAYAAKIVPKCMSCVASPGSSMKFVADVTNVSEHPWPQDDISLSARLLPADHSAASAGSDTKVVLGAGFSPHQSRPFIFEVIAPPRAGQYRLEVDVIHDGVTAFSARHTRKATLPVTVNDVSDPADCPTPRRAWSQPILVPELPRPASK